MNFMKTILVLAATLAIVAVSFASANCDHTETNESCDLCCIGDGYKSGILIQEPATFDEFTTVKPRCWCSDRHDHYEAEFEAPSWRKA